MGWFSREPDRASLEGRRTVVIYGMKYVIRKVNPLMDFTDEKMPQIFTAYQARRKKPETPAVADERRARADMAAMIEAGLVAPKLVPEAKREEGLTVGDIMRDDDLAAKLYWEILCHSLNRFRGVKGAFFSLRLRLARWTALRNATASVPAPSPSPQAS